jgi:hypothetical protein
MTETLIFTYTAIPGGQVTTAVVLVPKLFPKSLAQNFTRQVIPYFHHKASKGKGKVTPLQARCGPEGG